MRTLIVACTLAAILGFAAHRASVCTVRAVAEIMSSRTALMLGSIGKSVLWAIAVTGPAFVLVPSAGADIAGWPITGAAVVGGFAFGLGAAFNGACAYSTLARLVDGEGGMLVTIIAFPIGIWSFDTLAGWHWLDRPETTPTLGGSMAAWAMWMGLSMVLWGTYEALRLWRTRPVGHRLRALILAPQYRLSSAAMLIGLAGTTIFLIYGSAGYTTTLQELVDGWVGVRGFPAPGRWILALAILSGMLTSTLHRGSFRPDWHPRRLWLRNAVGGLLMGLGVALTPGGNDTLLLYSIPTFSPHALPAFLAMLSGVVAGLNGIRMIFGIEMRVACRNDLFVIDAATSSGEDARRP